MPGGGVPKFRATRRDRQRGARLLEQSEKKAADAKAGAPTQKKAPPFVSLPGRPKGKASLMERDNPEQILEFHWDPTTYTIKKSAKYGSKTPKKGTEILTFEGDAATVISFNLFLDDVDQTHKRQRSVEQSLSWLFFRLRSVHPDDRTLPARAAVLPWMGRRIWGAGSEDPPILVLFGLSYAFQCVLTSASVKTIFQSPPYTLEEIGFDAEDQRVLGVTASGTEGIRRKGSGLITRAEVSIELKEHWLQPKPPTMSSF